MPSIVEQLEQRLPGWMQQDPFAHWAALMLTIAAAFDGVIEGVLDGVFSSMPGQVNTPDAVWAETFGGVDALPYIGRDRGIIGGLTEHPADYAERLRKWLDVGIAGGAAYGWASAGTAYGMLGQLASVLGPNPPRLRCVTAGGVWYTRESDGTFKIQTTTGRGLRLNADGTTAPETGIAHPWDWDSHCVPPLWDQNDPGRIWLIIYAPCNAPYLAGTEGKWGDGTTHYGDVDGVIGTTATPAHRELVRDLADAWRAAGLKLSHIIVAYDPASFDPLTPGPYPAAGMPDGYWGHHGKLATVAGVLTRVRARLATARYTRGLAGLAI